MNEPPLTAVSGEQKVSIIVVLPYIAYLRIHDVSDVLAPKHLDTS